MTEEEMTIRLKLQIVEQVVAEAQSEGDERWKRLNDEQVEPLRQQLKDYLVREGRYPPPATIGVLPGTMGAKQVKG